MNDRTTGGHSITGAFVFLLLGLFAVMSSVLVLGGVRAYRGTTAQADRNNGYRILSAYVRSRVRALDAEDVVSMERIEDVPVLTMTEDYDGEYYLTRLYCIDGVLREWFSEAGNPFSIGDGDVVTDAVRFEPSLEENGMLKVQLQALPEDEVSEAAMTLRCGIES